MKDINEILAAHLAGNNRDVLKSEEQISGDRANNSLYPELLTPEEEAQLNSWIVDNREAYDALKSFMHTVDQQQYERFSAEDAWSKIEGRLPDRKIKPLFGYKWMAMAAALTLLIGSVFYFNLFSAENTISFTAHERTRVELPDHSAVWLQKGAQISYSSNFNENRLVALSGNGFFEVTHSDGISFKVKSKGTEVLVLGTRFNVLENKNGILVEVKEGKVKLTSLDQSVILVENQSAAVSENGIGEILKPHVNAYSWADGIFNFDQTPISQVVQQLNGYYGEKLHLKNLESTCAISARFENVSLDEIITILELTCNLNVSKEGDVYQIY